MLHGSTVLEVAHEDMVVIYRASQILDWLCLPGSSQCSLSRARTLHLLQLATVSCFRKLPEAMTRRFQPNQSSNLATGLDYSRTGLLHGQGQVCHSLQRATSDKAHIPWRVHWVRDTLQILSVGTILLATPRLTNSD